MDFMRDMEASWHHHRIKHRYELRKAVYRKSVCPVTIIFEGSKDFQIDQISKKIQSKSVKNDAQGGILLGIDS